MIALFPMTAEFPLTNLGTVEANSIVCLRRVGAIDTARVELPIARDRIDNVVAAGSPVRLSWSYGSTKDELYGYVHSYRPSTSGYVDHTTLVVVGAAYPMFNERARTYYRVGIHNVAEDICDDYMFELDTDPHPVMQEQILQQDESDWGLISRLADKWGYALYLDDVTMIFRPLDGLLADNVRAGEDAAVSAVMSPELIGGSLIEFKPQYQAAGSSPMGRNIGAGMEPASGEFIGWESKGERKGMFQNTQISRAVYSELEGEYIALAESVKNRFPFRAKAIFQTPIGKKPYDVYRIDHDGERSNWTILSVKHVMNRSQYMGDMMLGSYNSNEKPLSGGVGLDVPAILSRGREVRRPMPILKNTRPYVQGAGADVSVEDQRWRAEVRTVLNGAEDAA